MVCATGRRALFLFVVTAKTQNGWIAGASGPYDWAAPGMMLVASETHARSALAAIKKHFRGAAYPTEESARKTAGQLVRSLAPPGSVDGVASWPDSMTS